MCRICGERFKQDPSWRGCGDHEGILWVIIQTSAACRPRNLHQRHQHKIGMLGADRLAAKSSPCEEKLPGIRLCHSGPRLPRGRAHRGMRRWYGPKLRLP